MSIGGVDMDIYQAIWNADMNGNGLTPIFNIKDANLSQGYVVVNTQSCHSEHDIFSQIHIPSNKKHSYQLTEKLFDNYALNQTTKEKDSSYESKEVEEFLRMTIDSPPGKMAKKFIEEKSNKIFSEKQWYTNLYELWFRKFNWKSGKDLSGFEHIFVGEQKGKKLIGHHFWYKYWLEAKASLCQHQSDQIKRTCATHHELEHSRPEIITVGYHLKAFDYAKNRYIKINKKKCAFFVGLSAEGLIAMGTIRSMFQKSSPVDFVINEQRYNLELFMSPDGKSIRTFYPKYTNS